MENLYLKLSCAGDGFSYKIGEVNEADNWNFVAVDEEEMGGFNFFCKDNIARWLVRGETLYDVTIPDDAEVIEVNSEFVSYGIFRTNKIILNNPRKVTEEMVLDLYKKSKLTDKLYLKVLASYAIKGYVNVCKIIIDEKINKKNIDLAIDEYLNFYDQGGYDIEMDENSKYVFQLLKEVKQ